MQPRLTSGVVVLGIDHLVVNVREVATQAGDLLVTQISGSTDSGPGMALVASGTRAKQLSIGAGS